MHDAKGILAGLYRTAAPVNWADYGIGIVSGAALGMTWAGWVKDKTIRTYKQIVKDYEVMVAKLLCQVMGLPEDHYTRVMAAMILNRNRQKKDANE